MINIEFDAPTDKEILLFMLDAQGRLMKTDQIEESTIEKNLNLAGSSFRCLLFENDKR